MTPFSDDIFEQERVLTDVEEAKAQARKPPGTNIDMLSVELLDEAREPILELRLIVEEIDETKS